MSFDEGNIQFFVKIYVKWHLISIEKFLLWVIQLVERNFDFADSNSEKLLNVVYVFSINFIHHDINLLQADGLGADFDLLCILIQVRIHCVICEALLLFKYLRCDEVLKTLGSAINQIGERVRLLHFHKGGVGDMVSTILVIVQNGVLEYVVQRLLKLEDLIRNRQFDKLVELALDHHRLVHFAGENGVGELVASVVHLHHAPAGFAVGSLEGVPVAQSDF